MMPRSVRRLGGRLIRGWQRLEFRVWRFANRRSPHKLVQVYGRHRVCVDAGDFRGYRVWRLGGTQKEKVELLAALCAAAPALVIDVGANYGEFSLIPASLGLRVLAIEPNPGVAACLRETFGGFPRVRVLQAAASNRNATLTFHYCESATGSGSLARNVADAEAQAFERQAAALPVEALRLEDIPELADAVRGSGLLMKIDVEGFEDEVLEGAGRLLTAAAWWRAITEFSPACLSAAGKDAGQVWRSLCRFSGRLLAAHETGDAGRLGTLPEQPPARDVDLLLGAGQMP